MRILLINYHDIGNINTRLPKSLNQVQGIYPPLGLAYIGAVLENEGHIVNILDCKALNLTSVETKEKILEVKPDIVGITAMTSTFGGSLEAAKLAKECGNIVVMGGPQLSAYPKETMSYDIIDYGIVGEGEYAMLELVIALERESPNSFSSIKGLVYRKNGEIIVNEPAIIEDIDSLPYPARHLLPMEKYHCVITKSPFTTMISSRGCPYQCGFCFKQPSDKKMRFRNPLSVVDEIEHLIKEYKIKEIMFYDDTITLNREHIEGICNEIINRKIKIGWESPTRINNVDKELLKLMHDSGCIRLRYGVESGDERILKLMRKNITISEVKDVFKWTKQNKIETYAYFIIGYATETPQTINKTIKLAKELNPDWVMFTVATPYPHTHLHMLAQTYGLISSNYWIDFINGKTTKRIPYFVEDADKWIEKAYKSFYLRPEFIFKKLTKLTSIDVLKKYITGFFGIVSFKQ